jgi:four helix bundle protein
MENIDESANRIKSYRDLKVWQKSLQLCLSIYRTAKRFPPYERYGLSSQMKRASLSVPSNIAEGVGRKSRKEYARM